MDETTETLRERLDEMSLDDIYAVLRHIVEGVPANGDDPVPYWLASLLNDHALIDYAAWKRAVREGQGNGR